MFTTEHFTPKYKNLEGIKNRLQENKWKFKQQTWQTSVISYIKYWFVENWPAIIHNSVYLMLFHH